MDFLYYLPASRGSREAVLAAGLGYALGPGGPTWAPMAPGPDGQAGVVCGLSDAAPVHAAGDVRWTRMGGLDAWLGLLESQPPGAPGAPGAPGPADLVRAETLPGHWVRLGDGGDWLIPAARLVRGGTLLPQALVRAQGAWTRGDVLPAWRDLWDGACRVWDALYGGLAAADEAEEGEDPAAPGAPAAPVRLTLSDECDLAVRAIAANYRVGPDEVSALSLLTTTTQMEVLKALVDWPALLDLAKKARPPGEAASSPGNGASSPNTDPPSPNSC